MRNKLEKWFGYLVYKVLLTNRTFAFQGKRYRYFCHRYNTTWRNERSVEVPICLAALNQHRGSRVLEVGNVLSHYGPIHHDVVDKYEVSPGVMNLDILDFVPERGYDLILSISTLEHVGWDEPVREVDKILRAIDHLRGCLASGGQMVVTLPIGYNSYLDEYVNSGRICFARQGYLWRKDRLNTWQETDWQTAQRARYGSPYSAANALVVGFAK